MADEQPTGSVQKIVKKDALLGKALYIEQIEVINLPERSVKLYSVENMDTNEHISFYGSFMLDKQNIQRGDTVVLEKLTNEANGHTQYHFILYKQESGQTPISK